MTILDDFYIFRSRAFLALHHVETDSLPLSQRLEAAGLNCTEMYEQISAVVLFNEAETFLLIEPLDFSFFHLVASSFHKFVSRMQKMK